MTSSCNRLSAAEYSNAHLRPQLAPTTARMSHEMSCTNRTLKQVNLSDSKCDGLRSNKIVC